MTDYGYLTHIFGHTGALGPCQTWALHYHDGAVFTHDDGAWSEAPCRHVMAYDVNGHFIRLIPWVYWSSTLDRPVHTYEIVPVLQRSGLVKFGVWVTDDLMNRCLGLFNQWFQEHYRTSQSVQLPFPWTIFYHQDGGIYTVAGETEADWQETSVDEVLMVVCRQPDEPIGKALTHDEYYFFQDGILRSSNRLDDAVQAVPWIKQGTVCSHCYTVTTKFFPSPTDPQRGSIVIHDQA